MQSKELFWIFQKFYDEQTCDKIIANTDQFGFGQGTVHHNELKPDIRDVKVQPSTLPSIDRDMWNAMCIANGSANWKLNIDYYNPHNIMKYDINGHYEWHQDVSYRGEDGAMSFADDTLGVKLMTRDDGPMTGKVRKLSASLLLNDNFQGGELRFAQTWKKSDKELHLEQLSPPLSKGDLIFFESTTFHKVEPVTSGTRYSAVVWYVGPPAV